MKEILKRWCETNQLSFEDAANLIVEYLSYDGRTISPEYLQAVLQIGQAFEPIAWDRINSTIARHYDCEIVPVYSAADQMGNRRLLCRKFYE